VFFLSVNENDTVFQNLVFNLNSSIHLKLLVIPYAFSVFYLLIYAWYILAFHIQYCNFFNVAQELEAILEAN